MTKRLLFAVALLLACVGTASAQFTPVSVTFPSPQQVSFSSPQAVTQSSTWTMQPGNTANTTPWLFTISQGGNAATVNGSGQLAVNCGNCTGSGVSQQDNTTFTGGSSNVAPQGALYDLTPPTIADGNVGLPRMDSNRYMYAVFPSAQAISGTVTANAGTGNFAVNLAQYLGSALSVTNPFPIRISNGTTFINGGTDYTHDTPFGTITNVAGPASMCRASAAAPADVSADDDPVLFWCRRNGAQVSELSSGGTLVQVSTGTAANALRIVAASNSPDVTSLDLIDDAIFADRAGFTPGTSKTIVFGGVYQSTPAALSNNNAGAPLLTADARLVIKPYADSANDLNGSITTSMTGTTSTAVSGMGAQGSGVRVYVTACTISNAHATVSTDVVLQDGSGGTTLWTIPATAVYGGGHIVLPNPIRTTANTGLFAANITTGASTKVSCTGYKGA